MQEKDFITYEYRTKKIKAEKQAYAADMYEAFGWEITSVSTSLPGTVTLSMKRDRKLPHIKQARTSGRKHPRLHLSVGKSKNLRRYNIFFYFRHCRGADSRRRNVHGDAA